MAAAQGNNHLRRPSASSFQRPGRRLSNVSYTPISGENGTLIR